MRLPERECGLAMHALREVLSLPFSSRFLSSRERGRRTALFSSWARHFAEIGHFVGHQGVFFLLFLLYRVVPSFFYNEEEMQGDFLSSLFVIRKSLFFPLHIFPFSSSSFTPIKK